MNDAQKPPGRLAGRLLLLSALALFFELALIRWLSTEVRIFAYFKNLVLIACFVGFGLGMFRRRADGRLVASLALLIAVITPVALSNRFRWEYGPEAAAVSLASLQDAYYWGGHVAGELSWGLIALGLIWIGFLFAACIAVMIPYAQRIGADIEAFGPQHRLTAYTINIMGSIAGVLAFWLTAQVGLPPLAWFGLVIAATAPFVSGRLARLLVLLTLPVLVLVIPPERLVHWSPYQKLQVYPERRVVAVNGVGYMTMDSMKDWAKRQVDRYKLPHLVRPHASKILIVGAGGGNDVSAALRAGAKHVVAVEIDPTIYGIGRRFHPDQPYQDPRVRVVLDDARHFAETTDERFDLVIFSHLDAHGALSSFTNVRLDNYVHTVESFQTFRRLLEPQGALYVSFYVVQPWVAQRLKRNLSLAFEKGPEVLEISNQRNASLAHFISSDAPEPRQRAALVRDRSSFSALKPVERPPPPSTDDWPYLYVQNRRVPLAMVIMAAFLLVITGGIVVAATRGVARPVGGALVDRHYFFLGAAFLLVEVHNVGKLARVFGTTWATNTWVIVAILSVILLANAIASRWLDRLRPKPLYAALVGFLLLGAFVPVEALLQLPLAPALVTIFYTTPLLFAGLIFAGSFAKCTHPGHALGSNILGSVCGGMLELFSFVTGLASLLLLAAGLYLLSFPGEAWGRASEETTEP